MGAAVSEAETRTAAEVMEMAAEAVVKAVEVAAVVTVETEAVAVEWVRAVLRAAAAGV